MEEIRRTVSSYWWKCLNLPKFGVDLKADSSLRKSSLSHLRLVVRPDHRGEGAGATLAQRRTVVNWALQPHADGGNKGTEGVWFKARDKNRDNWAPYTSREFVRTYKSGYEGPLKSQDNLSLLRDQVGTRTLHFSLGWDQYRAYLWAFFPASQTAAEREFVHPLTNQTLEQQSVRRSLLHSHLDRGSAEFLASVSTAGRLLQKSKKTLRSS